MKKQIYLRNISKRWKAELNTHRKIYIFSPYLTSQTADNVLDKTSDCEIYTTFNVENFLNGSSSIKTLRRLLLKGCKVYSLPKLHAKLVIVSDTFISIGSQNLTNAGTKNREATFTSSAPALVRFVEKEVSRKWLADKKLITLQMLEDVEKLIRPLKKKYREMKADIEKAESDIFRRENEREKAQRAQRLTASLEKINLTQEVFRGIVQPSNDYSHYVFSTTASKLDLIRWRIGDKAVLLNNHERYLGLIKESGKLAWVKVNKTRLSFFENSLRQAKFFKVSETECQLTFLTPWDENSLKSHNLLIILDGIGQEAFGCKIEAFFELRDIQIVSLELTGNKELAGKLAEWIKANQNSFKQDIIERLLRPFKYLHNLTGVDADMFLERWGRYQLRLGEINDKQFLLFQKL